MVSGRCPAVPASGLALGRITGLDCRGPRFRVLTGSYPRTCGGAEDVAAFLAAENIVVALLFLFQRDQSLRLAASAMQGVLPPTVGYPNKKERTLIKGPSLLVTR